MTLPVIPLGSGAHPIALVVIAARQLAASSAFYARLFGWTLQPMSAEMHGAVLPGGPMAALRSDFPEGAPTAVPYIHAADLDAMLERIIAAGGTLEKAPWKVPMVGRLARFRDPSGTMYGLTDASPPGGAPHIPMPLGANPRPPVGALCSLEMYAVDGRAAPFFPALFGWTTLATMPQYLAFDAGAGVGGVFQSHTPTAPAMPYIYSADVPAALTAIEAAGGTCMGDAMAMPGMGTFGYFTDPSGTAMGLIGP